MKPTTADHVLQMATELELAPALALQQALRESGGDSAEAFGAALVRRELLTGYQLDRLLRGERTGYFYGRAMILYQIGAGAFARVYRALHRDTGGVLAVKVLRSRFTADADKRAAFQREGEMGRTLRHPHIVSVEDVGQEHNVSYITLEFVEGQTLRQLVKIRGALEVPTAVDLIRQSLAGLEYAHRRGVTHRDLKASNVLVSSTGVAKLVDFGLAGVDATGDRHLTRGAAFKTVDYAALEKATGVRDDDVRSDIYFLGTVAYLVLAGTPPFEESRDRSVRSDPRRFTIVEPITARAPQVPREAADLVARMMQLDPQERFQTAADARRAAEDVLAKLAEGGATPAATSAAAPAAEGRPATRGSIMLVESGEKPQQRLREFFTKLGYRVLLTENPQRALARFSSQPAPADCLVISAQSLGRAAVEAFNAVSADPFLAPVPAVLLVSARQQPLAAEANVDALRRVVEMPIGGREMREILSSLTSVPG